MSVSSTGILDDTIARLGSDLVPVRRLRPPVARAAFWLAAAAGLGVMLAAVADLTGTVRRLASAPDMLVATLSAALTALLAAWAAFALSIPGRSGWWAVLPLPSTLAWIAASGLGCLRASVLSGTHPASLGEMRGCFLIITAVSVPLSILLVTMVRRACPLRPNLTAALGGLASAAAAATLLTLVHPHDATALDLSVHLLAVVLVVGLNLLLGGKLLAPPTR